MRQARVREEAGVGRRRDFMRETIKGWMWAVGCAWLGLAGASCSTGGGSSDAGSAVATDAGNAACPDNAASGQQLAVGELTAALTSLAPEPPEKGDNTWVVQVKTAAGAPVTGAVVKVKPVMPLHGHGTTPSEFVGVEGGAGSYRVGPFNLFMPGTWNVPVRVQQAGQADVEFMFHACVTG
jgi:hypothetical protein